MLRVQSGINALASLLIGDLRCGSVSHEPSFRTLEHSAREQIQALESGHAAGTQRAAFGTVGATGRAGGAFATAEGRGRIVMEEA